MDTDVVTTLVSGWALLAAAIIAAVTRYGNAYLSKPDSPDWVTGPLAIGLAGLGAIATYIVDVKGAGTWQGALTVFVGALTATKAIQAIDPGVEPVLKETKGGILPTPAVGGTSLGQGRKQGKPTPPAEAVAVDPTTIAPTTATEAVSWSASEERTPPGHLAKEPGVGRGQMPKPDIELP